MSKYSGKRRTNPTFSSFSSVPYEIIRPIFPQKHGRIPLSLNFRPYHTRSSALFPQKITDESLFFFIFIRTIRDHPPFFPKIVRTNPAFFILSAVPHSINCSISLKNCGRILLFSFFRPSLKKSNALFPRKLQTNPASFSLSSALNVLE